MGDPRRLKKKYDTPNHPWEKQRIDEEKKLVIEYGLKNKRELWRAQTLLRKYRHLARSLVGLPAEERQDKEKVILGKMGSLGLIKEEGSLDDILSLKVEDILERRLQTIVWKKGLALTPKQARQFIVHGHVKVNGIRTTSPGMIVDKKTEATIDWVKEPIQLAPPKQETMVEAQDKAIEEGENNA